ncbi:DUF4397 domain-containing protein [Ilumatobacter sp.]|uniref:DUF4397 domain-containing protein n=1 Tax=Ilumatobacter sp. TaxID=1967498 RepID=UPI003AF98717
MKRVLMSLAALSATVLVPNMASAQASVDLTLVHGLPGVTADVAVDGTVVIDDFVPGSLANITSFAGQTLTNLTVTDDSTGDVVIGPIASVEVPASGSHSLVVHLDDSGTPVLSTFANNTDAVTSGEARLTLRHTAEAPAVDLIIGTERPIVAATNGQSGEVERAAGQLSDAQLAPTGEAAIATLPALDMAANTNTVVYVIGSTSADTLDFVVQIVDIAGASATTTTDPDATTTTTNPNATTTSTTSTSSTSTTSTSVVPTAVNTGSPLDGNSNTLLVTVALGGLALAGGAMYARRRV